VQLHFTGRGATWTHNWQPLHLLEVRQGDTDPAAASSSSSSRPVLVAPLEGLEAAAQAAQMPLLIHVDAVQSAVQPSDAQKQTFRNTLRDRCVCGWVAGGC
jgi:hypothetical protein